MAGTDRYDPEVSRAVKEARGPPRVGKRRVDGARGRRPLDEAREYVMRWALTSERRAENVVNFITDPMWRSYAITYTMATGLCKEFVAGDPERFKRLLTEQLTAADLR